jgi:hypothetical protein
MHVRALVSAVTCVALGLLAGCREEGELAFPPFPPVAGETRGSVDLTLGPMALWVAGTVIPESDPDAAQVKRILAGLKSVRVRTYQLPSGSPFPEAQIAELRSQLAAPGWSPLVQTHNRAKGEDVAVYLSQDDNTVHGIAVLAIERGKVTIVNVVGTIRMEDVAALTKIAANARKGGDIQWRTTED